MAGVVRVAVLATQHMAVDTQAHADAGAPGHVGAMRQSLQGPPAALGHQCGDRVVGHMHARKYRPQWRLEDRAGPVVGQAPCRAGQSTTDIGRRQFDASIADQKRTTGRHTDRTHITGLQPRTGATRIDQAQHLHGQRIVVALRGRRLADPSPQTMCIGHADGHLGAAHVDTGADTGHAAQKRLQGLRIGVRGGIQWRGRYTGDRDILPLNGRRWCRRPHYRFTACWTSASIACHHPSARGGAIVNR